MSIAYSDFDENQIYNMCYTETHKGNYVAYLRGWRIKNQYDFFCEVSATFQFPSYFGENWMATDECLADLDWLSFKSLLVIVDGFKQSFREDVKSREMMLKIFEAMDSYWTGERIQISIFLNN